ncbi:semaphorin-4E [Chanos chanos]|uniref:Semaphorin-4E n=1 Tax=Chanos chanos TaxID=29144 RepID=A0A6J2W7Q6_CHACN|nr:semaphorin-4E-like [Chanos chanos]
MSLPFFLVLLCCVCSCLVTSTLNDLDRVPRKTILYPHAHVKRFKDEGTWNYSSMLLREDLGLLILGAREAVYALDIGDISVQKSKVPWEVTEDKRRECTYKGKHFDYECRNHIRTLHQMDDGTMYVCGTNAYSPTCDYMTYEDGEMRLENVQINGKGKCPFDPFQRYSSVMVGDDLYSATSMNFLGSEPVILRSSPTVLRTEFKSSWLNEPSFIFMDLVREGEGSAEGDDDKVYLFFSESAVEYDFHSKLTVSRVARVCKGDLGGQRTLQKKWTSFLKARLDCSVSEPSLPYVVQDVYHLQHSDWRESVFYAVFTPQSSSANLSTVCAYKASDISGMFSHGRFKTPVTVETSHVKWVMYSGELPVPRPGACIDNVARSMNMERSLDLPDKTLQFIRDRPLMDETVRPLTGGPLLIKSGAAFTRLVVDSVSALDGHAYPVMFIGTDNGFIQKAVNYDGEMYFIEEVQVLQEPEPIKILRLSSATGHLFAGSDSAAVQMPLSNCGRYHSCLDCVLARDPYCAWDLTVGNCSTVPNPPTHANMVQSLKDPDTTVCPASHSLREESYSLALGSNIKLGCRPDSNLARILWLFSREPLLPSDSRYISDEGILILNFSSADAGQYTCDSVERVNGKEYHRTLALFYLELKETTTEQPELNTEGATTKPALPCLPGTQVGDNSSVALKVAVAFLAITLVAFLLWNLIKGHLRLPGCFGKRTAVATNGEIAHRDFSPCPGFSLSSSYSRNSNHNSSVVAKDGGMIISPRLEKPKITDVFLYIDEESEI